jgi:hypothetical protein
MHPLPRRGLPSLLAGSILGASLSTAACSIRDATFLGPPASGDGGVDAQVDAAPEPVELVVSRMELVIAEGQAAALTVALTRPPRSPVRVDLIGSASISSVSPPTLTFTAATYDVPQGVTVTAAADANFDFEDGEVRVAAAAAADRRVRVRVIEPEIIELTAATGVTCPDIPFEVAVRLRGDPRGALTVTAIAQPGSGGVVTPASLGFDSTSYSLLRATEVTGAQGLNTLEYGAPGATPRLFKLTVRLPNSPACIDPM